MDTSRLLFYTCEYDSLLARFARLLTSEDIDVTECYNCISELIAFGTKHCLSGNLWKLYITYVMVYNENPYSVSCEIKGSESESLDSLARNDFTILKTLFDYNIRSLPVDFDINNICDFGIESDKDKIFNRRIRDRICELANELEVSKNVTEFQEKVVAFYKTFGVGMLGLHKAFRLDDNGDIMPINGIAHVTFDDLVGYEIQKNKLISNTNAFVCGRRANNCLLYGDSGTGKSTSIKAITNQYYDKGLRVIEVYKHQFKYINKIIAYLKNRNYYFIIYMDDLSFEDFEIEYKYLKAVIEGGLEKKPDNILIYATSNRRHLIKESFSDNLTNGDLHKNDSKEEKLSLADRFGVSIYYGAPTPKEFKEIVLSLRDKSGIDMSDEEILSEANKWELSHNGLSGRTARQFIDYILGTK